MRIAVDAMTCERGVGTVVKASVGFLQQHPDLHIVLCGDAATLEAELDRQSLAVPIRSRIEQVNSSQVITQHEDPVMTLRNKRQSSTHVALQLAQKKIVDAVVSCANTGALIAASRYYLRKIAGIKNVILLGSFPTHNHDQDIYLADIGASVDASAEQLWQYAHMAQAYVQGAQKNKRCRIGLISNGTEKIKGNAVVRAADALLRNDGALDYAGYVEGSALFSGDFDIAICDGFIGNAILKSCEGAAKIVTATIRQALTKNVFGYMIAPVLRWLLQRFAQRLRPSKRNGALLLGVGGVVVKSHGNSDQEAFETALAIALQAVKNKTISQLENMSVGTPANNMV